MYKAKYVIVEDLWHSNKVCKIIFYEVLWDFLHFTHHFILCLVKKKAEIKWTIWQRETLNYVKLLFQLQTLMTCYSMPDVNVLQDRWVKAEGHTVSVPDTKDVGLNLCTEHNWGQDSIVGIVTRYRLEDLGIKSQKRWIFCTHPD